MNSFPQGGWRIDGVLINRETVLNDEGYRFLEIEDDKMTILPTGMSFTVKQSRADSAVLESQGQEFYADIERNGDSIQIELSRPKFKEKIMIEAVLVVSPAFDSAELN